MYGAEGVTRAAFVLPGFQYFRKSWGTNSRLADERGDRRSFAQKLRLNSRYHSARNVCV